MRMSLIKSSLVRTAVAACLGAVSAAASAGFVLTPSVASVPPGGSFQVTLSYQDAAPLDFGFQFDLSSPLRSALRLTRIGASSGSPVDPLLLTAAPVPPVDLTSPVVISAVFDPLLLPGDWSAGVDLLTLSLTLSAGATPNTTLSLAADNGLATIDFKDDVGWSASTSVRVGQGGQLPEGGTLGSVAIALAALGLVRRCRGGGRVQGACDGVRALR